MTSEKRHAPDWDMPDKKLLLELLASGHASGAVAY